MSTTPPPIPPSPKYQIDRRDSPPSSRVCSPPPAMAAALRRAVLLSLLVLCRLDAGAAAAAACPVVSAAEAVLGPPVGSCLAVEGPGIGGEAIGVVEGDEVALLRALNLVHANRADYVAVLFYASWCPFSKLCRPNFNILSFMFPSIHHFSFDESVIRPSIVSRYGVHGFPTLFLLNSTMRVRYHGSRTINSLVAFYNDVTGLKPTSLDLISVKKIIEPVDKSELKRDDEQEDCPFSWARSPEKLLQQDAYLALATFFVMLRLLYFLLPNLNDSIARGWRRHMQYTSFKSFWDQSQEYLRQVTQGLNRLNRCKRQAMLVGERRL